MCRGRSRTSRNEKIVEFPFGFFSPAVETAVVGRSIFKNKMFDVDGDWCFVVAYGKIIIIIIIMSFGNNVIIFYTKIYRNRLPVRRTSEPASVVNAIANE